ncbi:MAG: hypothetical protein HFJ24_06915 [Clostridia bacterium]|nr:hypothetical protein [Clostridia bacterium]MCI9275658.1 hypothetical protein [Clostridia bacterium]
MVIATQMLAFLVYASSIFFINEYYLLGIIFLVNLFLMLILKISLKKAFIFIVKLMPFILFTGVLNLILGGLQLGIIITIKLILVCNTTFVFSENMTPKKIQIAIEKLCFPLKIFKINPRNVGIMVSISIAFIPIMQREMQNLKYSLNAKGFKFDLRNILGKPSVILLPLIVSILKKTDEIEQSMVSRGYMI